MLADSRVEATVPTTDLGRARAFYEGPLGLSPAGAHTEGVDIVYACGADTQLLVYERSGAPLAAHTAAHFIVDDVQATVRELRERGVVFEHYDLPNLKTVDGVAAVGPLHFAWFKDLDDNVLGIHD